MNNNYMKNYMVNYMEIICLKIKHKLPLMTHKLNIN